MKDFEFKVVTVNSHGEIIDRQFHTARQFIERLESSLSIEMVEIPDNMFQMGSPPGQGFYDELPRHNVKISTFLIGKYPVTQEQWNAVMGWLPPCRTKGSKHPVDRVSWNDAITFCEKLHMITGRNYRLPSEAEWEYACRAGTTSPFYFGETITTDLSNYVGEYIYQSEPKGIYRHGSTDVGSFPPNMFGIYDMHGNVWEWCADTWHDSYIGAPSDGSIWDGRNNYPHVLRGGCWHDPPNLCRSAARLQHAPDEGEDFFGFRVALTSLEQHPNLEFGHGSTRHNLYSQQIKLIMDRILSWLKPKNQG
jgi:formylglycine-generating enzyme required for sulfatase activity